MMGQNSFLALFLLLALGIYLGSLSFFNPFLLLLGFLAIATLWVLAAYKGRGNIEWPYWAILSLGMLALGRLSIAPSETWLVPREGEFSGQVVQVASLTFEHRVIVRLKRSRQEVAIHLPQTEIVVVGDTIVFTGTLQLPPSAANPGVFDYRSYLQSLGVYGLCYPDSWEIVAGRGQGRLQEIQSWLRHNVENSLQDPSLVLALVLGDKGALKAERTDTWRRLGISHLLAISGMHVGFIALGLGVLMERLRLRPVLKLGLTQVGLLFYIILAGQGASAWRAFFASSLGGYGAYRGFQRDSLRIWAFVGWTLLLLKPQYVFMPAFTLSFAASGGILLWVPLLRFKLVYRLPSYLLNSILISLLAQVSLAPLLLSYFQEIALLGPIATLAFVPLVAVLLVGGLGVALGLGPLGLGWLLNLVGAIVVSLENLLLPWAWQWRGQAYLPEICLWWFFFVYAGLRLRRPRLTKPKRTYAQLTTFAACLLLLTTLPDFVKRPLEVTAVNVGQGDCYYIKTPSGLQILLDGGGDSPYWQARGRNVGKERLVPYLNFRQVPRLDYVILSHPHEDHLFGLLSVLEEFEVGMVLDNGHSHLSPSYERYLELLEEKHISYQVIKAGDRLSLGDGIVLDVLYPEAVRETIPSTHNNNSLLLRLTYGGVRLLFTGDLEQAVLYDLTQDLTLDLRAQWLKIPHHGSSSSLQKDFYQAVQPKWAVISVGPNSFGHPHEEVLSFLEDQRIAWRSTEKGPETFQVWWGILGRFLPSSR